MRLHIVPARTGIAWLRLGLKTFARQPLAFISLFFFFMALASIVSMVPLVGTVLTMLLLPTITLAMMAATAQAGGPDKPAPGLVFVAALQAVRKDMRSLFALGVIYAACFLVVIAVSVLIDGGDFARVYLLDEAATLEMAQARDFQIALWVTMLLSLPLSLAFWHAPALVHWHGVAPIKSIFFSVVACLRNFGAFTVFGLMWFGVIVAVGIVLSLVTSILIVFIGIGKEVASVLMIGGILVMTAMFFSSIWFSFRDSFDAD